LNGPRVSTSAVAILVDPFAARITEMGGIDLAILGPVSPVSENSAKVEQIVSIPHDVGRFIRDDVFHPWCCHHARHAAWDIPAVG